LSVVLGLSIGVFAEITEVSIGVTLNATPRPTAVKSRAVPPWVAETVTTLVALVLTQYTVPSVIPVGNVESKAEKNVIRSSTAKVCPGIVMLSSVPAVNAPWREPLGPFAKISEAGKVLPH
jgi:hypothetical protein